MSELKWEVGLEVKGKYNNVYRVIKVLGPARLEVTCNVCHKDEELWPEPVVTCKASLRRGGCSCSCSGRARYTEDQYRVLLSRKAGSRGKVFKGFKGCFENTQSLIVVYCPIHNTTSDTTSVYNFLHKDLHGCPKCANTSTGRALSIKGKELLEEIHKIGFTHYTGTKGIGSACKVFCSICSEDIYARSGLCDGWFSTSLSHLRENKQPCRCSKSHSLSEDQLVLKMNSLGVPTGNSFVRWKNPVKPNNTRNIAIMTCNNPEHPEYEVMVNNFINQNNRCPSCSSGPKMQSYIDFVYKDCVPVFLKFGIAVDAKDRCKRLNRTNKDYELSLSTYFLFDTEEGCREAEKQVKDLYYEDFVKKVNFPDGYTETASITDYDNIVKIFLKHGGVRGDKLI